MNRFLKNRGILVFFSLAILGGTVQIEAAASSSSGAPSLGSSSNSRNSSSSSGAAASSDSSSNYLSTASKSQSAGLQASDFRYYSKYNLDRINKKNRQLRKIKARIVESYSRAAPPKKTDLEISGLTVQPHKKHAPLMIFADPTNSEKISAAFKIILHDVAHASFNPVILLNYSLLQNFQGTIYNFDPSIFAQSYKIYDIPDTQFVVLIPKWFLNLYGADHGLRLESFTNKTSLLNNKEALFAWLAEKEAQLHATEDQLIQNFVTDLEKVFVPQGMHYPAPIWDIYLGGHGKPQTGSLEGSIAGLPLSKCIEMLTFFSTQVTTGTMLIRSCSVGGVNARALNIQINRLDQPLLFHLILAAVGDTITSAGTRNKTGSSLLKDPRMTQLIENYFQNAAQLENLEKYYLRTRHKKTEFDSIQLAQASFRNILDSLIEKISFSMGSTHGSEYLPQFKLKGSKRFKTVKDDPRFFIIDRKTLQEDMNVPNTTHTIILYEQEIQNLILNPYKASDSTLNSDYRIDNAFEGAFPTVMFQSWIVMPQSENIDDINNVYINHLTLKKNSLGIGICAFLRDSFLTTLIENKVRIHINTLSGIDDFSMLQSTDHVLSYDFEIQQPISSSKKSTDEVTLENVIIDWNIPQDTLNVSFKRQGVLQKISLLRFGKREIFNAITKQAPENHTKELEKIEKALASGISADIKDKNGSTLLMRACSAGREDIARLLLSKGASVDITDQNGQTALMCAFSTGNINMMRLLLDRGADPNAVDLKGTPLLIRAYYLNRRDIIELLLRKGAFPDIKDSSGDTVLVKALFLDGLDLVNLLIMHEANPNIKNNSGNTPLHSACIRGIQGVINKLLEFDNIDLSIQNNAGQTPLDIARNNRNIGLVSQLVQYMLQQAVEAGNIQKIAHALAQGADINYVYSNDNTLLHLTLDPDVADFLLSHGAHIDAQNRGGYTPLHYACQDNNIECAKVLLDQGANPFLQLTSGNEPISLATDQEVKDLVQSYMDYYDNINREDSSEVLPAFDRTE